MEEEAYYASEQRKVIVRKFNYLKKDIQNRRSYSFVRRKAFYKEYP